MESAINIKRELQWSCRGIICQEYDISHKISWVSGTLLKYKFKAIKLYSSQGKSSSKYATEIMWITLELLHYEVERKCSGSKLWGNHRLSVGWWYTTKKIELKKWPEDTAKLYTLFPWNQSLAKIWWLYLIPGVVFSRKEFGNAPR